MDVSIIETTESGEKDFKDVKRSDVVILPAFGASVGELTTLKDLEVQIVDTTCPWVSKVLFLARCGTVPLGLQGTVHRPLIIAVLWVSSTFSEVSVGLHLFCHFGSPPLVCLSVMGPPFPALKARATLSFGPFTCTCVILCHRKIYLRSQLSGCKHQGGGRVEERSCSELYWCEVCHAGHAQIEGTVVIVGMDMELVAC